MSTSDYAPAGALFTGRLVSHEWSPCASLAGHVVTYFAVEIAIGARGTVRTLPEGCADLIFDLGSVPRAWISGPRTSARVFEHVGPVHLFGAQLLPGVARLLSTSKPARELVDASAPLDDYLRCDVMPLVAALRGAPPIERAPLLDAFLLSRLGTPLPTIEPRVQLAVNTILSDGGASEITTLARQAGASARNLTRLFDEWIGVGPKRLCRMVRFQRAVESAQSGEPINWSALAAELGYADQAHLIRELRDFAQLTPTEL